jgi:hypothetical protein
MTHGPRRSASLLYPPTPLKKGNMTNLDDFITQYVATWNEPDPDVRRKWISSIWSEHASLYNGIKEYHGHTGIEQAVKRSYDLFGSRGFLFRPRAEPVSHHGAIRFAWEMITAADGEVDSLGTQFLILDDDGRIRLDYQFIEKPPTS